MYPREYAARWPGKPAMIMAETGRTVTYRELDERSSQLAWLLDRRGIGRDATVAVIAGNVAEWAEVIWGANRSGRYIAPVNWHVSPQEMAELLTGCQAAVVVTTAAALPTVRAALPGAPGVRLGLVIAAGATGDSELPPGFESYQAALEGQPTTPVVDERLGGRVMFSSGTTGQPKVIRHDGPGVHPAQAAPHLGRYTELFSLDSDTVYLSPAPTYHTSPYRFVFAVLQLGGTVVCLERFDPAAALAAIGGYSATHAQFVPTMFVRMLRLPEQVRREASLGTLKVAITGAARCSAELKQQVMDWWGPVVYELYGASESYGNCAIGPADALTHPGSVGQALVGTIHITGEDGHELPAGQQGQVWFEGTSSFSYTGQAGLTSQVRNAAGWLTVGDLGWVDEDGYLYLAGRKSDVIVSGGVNIHPQRAEEVLSLHPAVADVGVIGVPDEEFGESMKAFVLLSPGHDAGQATADELLEYCRARLPHFQCPKTVGFVGSLPRGENGKLYKRVLLESYLMR